MELTTVKEIDKEIKKWEENIIENGWVVPDGVKLENEYKSEFVRWDSDKNMWWDTRLNKEYSQSDFSAYTNMRIFGVEDVSAHMDYLRALREYTIHKEYKEDGDSTTLGIGINSYNERIQSDIDKNRLTVDGTTIYAAEFDDKLNRLKTKVDDLYSSSWYFNQETTNLDEQIQAEATSDTESKTSELRQENLRKQLTTQQEVDKELNISPYFNASPGSVLGIRENTNKKENFPLSNSLRESLGITFGDTNGG